MVFIKGARIMIYLLPDSSSPINKKYTHALSGKQYSLKNQPPVTLSQAKFLPEPLDKQQHSHYYSSSIHTQTSADALPCNMVGFTNDWGRGDHRQVGARGLFKFRGLGPLPGTFNVAHVR